MTPSTETGAWSGQGLWRYRADLAVRGDPVTLGEGGTPIVPYQRYLLKLEAISPTGSFKDRGAATAITAARAAGATTVIEDSSGNAGTAIAAYAAAAGLKARIFAPVDIVASKARAIQVLGAELIKVSGPRSAVTEAATAAAKNAYDAGHARDDAFLEGTKTIAYELFEELGDQLHDVVTPVGQGTVLIGLAMGFADLVAAGRMERAPKLHGVQSEACAPLVRGAAIGRPAPVVPQPSIADGIRIPEPTRAERSYAAVRYSGGRWVAVSEVAIERAWRDAAAAGLLMEPTSAVAIAGARLLNLPPGAVLIITGSGLKAVERY
ncbi:MAG TPA: pyridoxal-phosphate dependent enzyme [Candidatus Dormibacteraeota bacterium]|nr:pyridoxal-phosphate dependent enzyme [Candidatus Dormibacteraeota bacterium]